MKLKKIQQTGEKHNWKEDRLSSLPDALLVSILSLLPIENAAITSVLSRRWRCLWTQIHHLKLYHCNIPRCQSNDFVARLMSFVSTVNHIFQQLTSSKIHTFDLDCPCELDDDNDDIDCIDDTQQKLCESALETWARRICALNVEEIRVSREEDYFSLRLPFCMFQCQSLVVLEVDDSGFHIEIPDNGIINLPNLKKVKMTNIDIYDCDLYTMSMLFNSCTLLEDLDLSFVLRDPFVEQPVVMNISCPNLRSLSIKRMKRIGAKYVINAPRLEVINLDDCVAFFFCLLETPFSLIKAKIDLVVDRYDEHEEYDLGHLSNVIHWICFAKSLELSPTVLYPFVHLDYGALPRYDNLAQLQIYLNDTSAFDTLFRCLSCAPNLETLIVKKYYFSEGFNWVEPDSVPACLSRTLKKIEVNSFVGRKEELEMLKYILSNANALKLLHVCVSSGSTKRVGEEAVFCTNLFGCPRKSKACVIHFTGSYVQASSINNHSPLTLYCQIQHLQHAMLE